MLQSEKSAVLGDDRGRSREAQTRIYILIVAFVLCLLFISTAIFTPLIVLKNEDNKYTDNMMRLEQTLATAAVVPFRQAISNASVLTKAIEGYVHSHMRVLPKLNSSAQARIDSQADDFRDFHTVVTTIAKGMQFLAVVVLEPGGVYAQVWPPESGMIGRDVFLPTDYAESVTPTPEHTLHSGSVEYVGPVKASVKHPNSAWVMTVRRPIYNRTNTTAPVVLSNFWGFAMCTVNISGVLATKPFMFYNYHRDKRQRVDYLLTTKDCTTNTRVVVSSSLADTSRAAVEEFISTGTSVMVIPNNHFMITIRGRYYGCSLSADNVVIVVSTATAGLLVLFAAFAAFIIFYCRAYDAAQHAPKLAPFAMLTVGPCRGEELWELAPDEMVDVTDRLSRLLTRQMVRHHAYQIQQVHPLTTSYVTRSVAAAVQMAFDAIEELHCHPIDEPLRRLLGDDGRLLLSYAVHWCNDAVVRLDAMEGGYRYEGPDVVYGGRMWAFAAPNVVTVSEAVADALPRFGLRCLATAPYHRVNVVRSRTVCGATGDFEMSGSGGGAATIYVPFPAPTTVEATAGLGSCVNNNGSGTGGAAAVRGRDKDVPLPPQTLLTLVDPRRPVLLAARAAAPTAARLRPCPHLSGSFLAVAEGIEAADLAAATAASPAALHEVAAGSITVSVREADNQRRSCNVRSGGSFHSSEEDTFAPALAAPLPVSAGTSPPFSHPSNTTNLLRSSFVIQGDGVTRALLQPVIPIALDVALHVAFDYQSITLGMTYDAARVLVYYFYSSYKILFRPLAAPERHNIYRRLVSAFGVPQQGILEHLAARCAIRCLQQSAKLRQQAVRRRRANAVVSPTVVCSTESAVKELTVDSPEL